MRTVPAALGSQTRHRQSTSSSKPKPPCAGGRFDGGRGGDQGGRGPGLILPGGSGKKAYVPPPNFGRNAPNRLVLPGEESPQPGGSVNGLEGVSPPKGGAQFRPPPGAFLDAEDAAADEEATAGLTAEQMIQRLDTGSGSWLEFATYFPRLLAQGYPANIVTELTGYPGAVQSRMMVALSIYRSLKAAPEISEAQLHHFDAAGDELLFELRFLDAPQRIEAAAYLVDNALDQGMAAVLARSIKEWHRRPETRDGFSDAAGDCLAFKYYRDAQETKDETEKARLVAKGLLVSVTDAAAARLEQLITLEAAEAETAEEDAPLMFVSRALQEELPYRPIPVVGRLGGLARADLESVPRSSGGGVLQEFTLPAGVDCPWVCMPRSSLLASSSQPCVVQVEDCSQVPPIMASSGATSDAQKARLAGVGLMVVDAGKREVEQHHWYLTPGSGEGVALRPGAEVEGEPLARVLYVVRPPKRSDNQTEEMM